MNDPDTTHFSPLDRLEVDVSRVPEKGRIIKFRASENECLALLQHFSLVAVDFLVAELQLTRWRRKGAALRGTVTAKISQRCVISLEPVDQQIEEEINILYVEEGSPFAKQPSDASGELVLDPEGNDLPETLSSDVIRIDEVILEALALAIDPYPRLRGVELSAEFISSDGDNDRPASPFAVLDKLIDAKG